MKVVAALEYNPYRLGSLEGTDYQLTLTRGEATASIYISTTSLSPETVSAFIADLGSYRERAELDPIDRSAARRWCEQLELLGFTWEAGKKPAAKPASVSAKPDLQPPVNTKPPASKPAAKPAPVPPKPSSQPAANPTPITTPANLGLF